MKLNIHLEVNLIKYSPYLILFVKKMVMNDLCLSLKNDRVSRSLITALLTELLLEGFVRFNCECNAKSVTLQDISV